MKKVAVILSGCGVFDGAEVHESVLTLLALRLAGAEYACFAPDITQTQVIEHRTGKTTAESRNVLSESARIARGEIQPLSALKPADFDGVLIPGGFGVAKNLCDFAFEGQNMRVNEELIAVCQGFADVAKPLGYACIAPVMIPAIHGPGVTLTVGNDPETIAAIEAMGGVHKVCSVDNIVIDKQHKVVTTPAYMLATDITQAWEGIQKWVMQVLALCEKHHQDV